MDGQKFNVEAIASGVTLTEVGKDEFYGVIGPQNVTVTSVTGKYPYTCEFITSQREIRGRKVGYIPEGEALPKYRYYLPGTARPTDGQKFNVEVIADSSGKWCGNGLKFDSHEAADEYGSNLMARWTAVQEYRVVPVEQPKQSREE